MRTTILIAALLLFSFYSFGQLSKPKFGISAGISLSDAVASQNSSIAYNTLQATDAVGYRLGLLMDWNLVKNLSFSPKVELTYNDSRLTVWGSSGKEKEVYEVYPITLDIAGHFTYKLFRKGITPYLLAGPGYKIPLMDKETLYATKKPVLCIDFGVGVETKFRKFNLAPELRYSRALSDNSLVTGTGSLRFNTLAFVVNVKGK